MLIMSPVYYLFIHPNSHSLTASRLVLVLSLWPFQLLVYLQRFKAMKKGIHPSAHGLSVPSHLLAKLNKVLLVKSSKVASKITINNKSDDKVFHFFSVLPQETTGETPGSFLGRTWLAWLQCQHLWSYAQICSQASIQPSFSKSKPYPYCGFIPSGWISLAQVSHLYV